jgi:hypothetical protein
MLYLSIVVVAGMVLYELYSGEAIVRGTRRITRGDNPFRYWFWVVFHTGILAVLIVAWMSGIIQ